MKDSYDFSESVKNPYLPHGKILSRLKEFRIDASTRLRELTGDDAGALYALVDSNRNYLRQWLPWVDMQKGPLDSAQFIESARNDNQAGVALTLGIEHQGDIAGVIAFHELDRDNRQTSMGFWISSSHQGKGIVSSSCKRLIEHAFTDLGLNRVVMKIAEDNARSRRVAERLGLACEGVSKQWEWLYDHFVNQVIYAITADQWFADPARLRCAY
ncbi:MAG: GNAT family protein [Gammaproteobacteria bacterium]|nr:GNAT family protein [Gammaproteobacteria bacterium]